ncbi:Amidohydrolase family protein [Desulfuromusa kysingii]|uniref:Amidohydrolase family protein n=1 Tax=Desulfuromusa kysingii TaxID=37625 RepID=A0A1H4DEX2_9BACT|nr:amidohydrolase family protein [Desulfuromusa kysingii]SEA71295.1 Amidohydrolase family protein [Desulfuromusa kysingii]
MLKRYKIIFKNGFVVDPVNHRNGRFDIAIVDGQIAAIAPEIDPTLADESFDLSGQYVVPGIIDPHIHASAWLGGQFAHKMLARAGVTTALDMSGPIDSVLDIAQKHGTGLSLASVQYVRPEHTVANSNPGSDEFRQLLTDTLRKGAIGFKLLGGHYPLTPEATARGIEVCYHHGAYVAFHAGTLATGSNIEGFHEAIELAHGYPLHIAHINSYCRGSVRPYRQETEEAISALEAHPNIVSESYLSPFNGTSGECKNGVPLSQVTVTCLERQGFAPTEKGLEDAIVSGWGQVNVESGGEIILAEGESALAYWKAHDTDTTISFRVNLPEPRINLATVKQADGKFVVGSISTDGGGIPRNVIVESGLALVRLGALSMSEFVIKTSHNPAKMLGLDNKGHLGIGADADITVLNLETQKPVMSMANGNMVMFKGFVCGHGTRFITTTEGEAHVRSKGLTPLVIDLNSRPFCKRD